MAARDLSECKGWCTSQLMIILLGGRNSGKHSLGNLLLGKEEFVTKQRTSCSRRLGLVDGRWLTVVDTPAWWCDYSVQDTPELVKREILSSVSLCSPGPHVFLITIKMSSAFSEKRRRAVEEHVSLLGENVWSHCMVVFTSAVRPNRTEEHVEAEGKALRWLTEKCSQRCHSVVLGQDTEVSQLMEKIQKLVAENGNRVFVMQENILLAASAEKKGVEERAQLRFTTMKKHRSLMQERLRPIADIRIVLLGAKGSGKTSVLNTILSTEGIQPLSRTIRCVVGKGVVYGRQVTVVDTPGWWMNYFSDESSIFDRREMVFSLSLCPPGPHVFLLVIRVDRAFTETYRRAVQDHLQLISDHIWSRVIVLFSFGDWLEGTTIEHYIESEGEPLRWLIEMCGNKYHVLNNKRKESGFQVRELIGKIEEILSGCESGWHYEIERKVVEELRGKVEREGASAKERLMKKEKQREMARAQLENLTPQSEVRIVLLGGRKTGKSSCGNTILGRECFDRDTQTSSCIKKQGRISGRMVTVLDTPGGSFMTSDLLKASFAILVVVNVSSSFKDNQWKAIVKQLEAEGGQLWSRAVVLFSYGDWLGKTSIEQRIESEGELLQRLVDRCGNTYHVLDNKHWRDGGQVAELLDIIEEKLVEERLAAFHSGGRLWKSVSSTQEQLDSVTHFKELLSQLPYNLTPSATSSSCPSLNCSEGPGAAGQIVALPAGRAGGWTRPTVLDKRGMVSFLSSTAIVNLPVWFSTDGSHGQMRLSSDRDVCPLPPRHPAMLICLPQTLHGTAVEQNGFSEHSRCQPAKTDQTLRGLAESGGLQLRIEQWGDSSLEELEAFIDAYFEMVREQTAGSFQMVKSDYLNTEPNAVVKEADRKLSKLELDQE